MFINTTIKENDVATFKLNSGEEVVGRVKSINDDHYTLTKPMSFMMGAQGLGLVPYVFSAPQDADIDIFKHCINVTIRTDDTIAKQYMKQTTGLIV